LIFNGEVSGTLNPTTVISGAPMDPIVVPSGKIYKIKHLYINRREDRHKAYFNIDGYPLWGIGDTPGDVNFWLHEGQSLTMNYGGWDGYNGEYSDQYYVLIHVFEP
jgi:hypothetical protein